MTFSHISTIPTGHTKTVRAVAWAPSGNTLATASFDANIGIWEQEADEDNEGVVKGGEWECASLLEGHETECKSVAYSSSGTLLASCSRDKTVWVWEGTSLSFVDVWNGAERVALVQFTLILISSAWACSWNTLRMSNASRGIQRKRSISFPLLISFPRLTRPLSADPRLWLLR